MRLYFPVDETLVYNLDNQPRYCRPIDMLLGLIERRGAGSLHAHLKKMGWVVRVTTDSISFDQSFSTLIIELRLTEDGFSE